MKNIFYKNGFTLTELMTVVIILGILMGIAGGSYRKATERSNFNEGLVAAHTIMEAVERYHAEHTTVTKPKIADLDVALAHQEAVTGDDYAVKTKYFTVTVKDGSVEAKRTNGKYVITVYPETFGTNRFEKDSCTGKSKTDFCISVGYTSCTSGVCVKP